MTAGAITLTLKEINIALSAELSFGLSLGEAFANDKTMSHEVVGLDAG
jgi:hypothetical protein